MDFMPIVAAEGVGGLISNALSDVPTVFNSAMQMIEGNEVAMVFVGLTLAGAGIGLFHRLTGH